MAETDIGAATGFGIVSATAILRFRKANVAQNICTMAPSKNGHHTVRIPVYSQIALAATQTAGQEYTPGTATTIAVDGVDCVPQRHNIWATVSDLAAHGNTGLLVNAGAQLGNSVAAELDDQVADAIDDFTLTVGGAAIHMDTGVLFDAVAKLEATSTPRPYGSMLHPTQVYGNWGLTEDLADHLQFSKASADLVDGPGYAGSIGGVNIYTSPSANATSDQHKGCIMGKGAIGIGYIDFGGGNFIELRTERDELSASTNLVCNGYWASDELVDLHGVEIHTEIS